MACLALPNRSFRRIPPRQQTTMVLCSSSHSRSSSNSNSSYRYTLQARLAMATLSQPCRRSQFLHCWIA